MVSIQKFIAIAEINIECVEREEENKKEKKIKRKEKEYIFPVKKEYARETFIKLVHCTACVSHV